MTPTASPAPDGVVWQSGTVPGDGRRVPVRVLCPAGGVQGGRWLVWAHGGSWRAGSVAGWQEACADLAVQSGARVVGVEYRLAPAHRHPAALCDVLAAVEWAWAQAAGDGAGGRPWVAVGGDSAGGTLAAGAALAWRDRYGGSRPLAAQVLAYPPLDPACLAPSYHRNPGGFPDREGLMAAWRDYRGEGEGEPVAADGIRLYSTPLHAPQLSGLPPAVIAFGGRDPVADDSRTYARRLGQAGVPVVTREFPLLGHGAFIAPAGRGLPGRAPAGNALRRWLGSAVRALEVPAPAAGRGA
ncbi:MULTISPECIES: alpha/beta hydrolase fold domain-containing protein [Streptomycetaceae]|uniref:Esterase/lipase/thioesterase n=1 Tax=Streptantibioticus cattleyicolor (strain ATCC 35852 / DSM 46488 / JCM 4925 / NBRC 14057 / NRRL 8057) TaxID=1003195 RepID=F8JV15_STREN|nr:MULTISPECIES: alpha/beta hydrolase fold domain-containing protein [Streptomycetaceae]AEW98183.1 esterase/lipase/thioesterase [Streptantibioticus cattleyicolor NRRL 8057 = DSM 46488]MYS62567.1 alpha/beta hydrolase fold domain-containing protein [Streptomyces sp. SID5468]CCB78499.1 Esterase/lipase [Streptantibioticus cattleyicolor NRRL 8057 = DSM 46488]